MKDKFFIILTIITVLLGSALLLFYNESLYTDHLNKVHANPTESIHISKQLIAYFLTNEYISADIPQFTENENIHLLDVKKLMCAIFYLVPISLVIWLFMLTQVNLKRDLAISGASLILILWAGIIIPFPRLWYFFHLVFFPQGNWMFPATSQLIQTYPPQFFALMVQSFGLRSLSAALALLATSGLVPKSRLV
ncbi:MAG: DUF1461 domain-containing protein [Candidatus Nanoarchaeia archaeon]